MYQYLLRISSVMLLLNISLQPIFSASIAVPTIKQQLTQLNKYWAANTTPFEQQLQQPYQFSTHEQLIQTHLSLVERTLRSRSVNHLTPTQRNNRYKGLDILRAYWQEACFPQNTNHPSTTIPYFIDHFNTACAVGHILRESGGNALAQQIATEQNNAYIEDMFAFEGDLTAWASTMGFSVNELKWIQPAYAPIINVQTYVQQPTCGNSDGAIQLVVTSNITGVQLADEEVETTWYKISAEGEVMTTVNPTELNNISAGIYAVITDQVGNTWGGGVYKTVFLNDSGTSTINNATITTATCGANGAITLNNVPSNASVMWFDAVGAVIGIGNTVENIQGANPAEVIVGDPTAPILPGQQYFAAIELPDACMRFEEFFVPADEYAGAHIKNVRLKVALESAYEPVTATMKNDLQQENLLPEQQPFNVAPWYYEGTESMFSSVAAHFADNWVDWVLVEAIDPNTMEVVARKAGILQKDGRIIDHYANIYVPDSPETHGLFFHYQTLDCGNSYYFVVRQRNHIDIMTRLPITIDNNHSVLHDLTNPLMVMEGENQLVQLDETTWGMAAGDVNGDGVITVNDYNMYVNHAADINVYMAADVNIDGAVTVSDLNAYTPNASRIGINYIRY